MQKPSLAERLRYSFDNLMAKGTVTLIIGLALLSAVIVVFFSLLIYVTGIAPAVDGGGQLSLAQIAWMAVMRTLDAGTMGGDAGSWPFLFAMLAVTFGGVFVISTFIGVLTSGIEAKMEELRKGRSRVLEHNHTVILGWSPQVFTIIRELVEANANQRRACIVVLGERDKVEMEEEIRERVSDTKTTRVVCRSGSAINVNDLEMVNIHASRSIVVLETGGQDPDAEVIKTLLAITNNPNRRQTPYHIVAEIHDAKNIAAARLVGKDEATLVLTSDLISRITVQTCRQSGLSVVYTELLDFGGDELYFKEEPALVGKKFVDAMFAYEDSAVMGVGKSDGRVLLNPPMETLIEPGDRLIAISEDDDTILLSGKKDYGVDPTAFATPQAHPVKAERALILGWNRRVPTMVNELDKYVAPGSHLTLVSHREDGEALLARYCPSLSRQSVNYIVGDATDRELLDQLEVDQFDHLILVCDDDRAPQQADSRTLVTLLHLRDIALKMHKSISVVSEMLDVRNRELAEVTRADDFIVSDKLVSLMLSQLSENKELKAVFEDLFSPEGSEIYLKPVEGYVATGTPVNFYTVLLASARQKQVAIGYRQVADAKDATKSYGVVVNPDKAELVTFAPGDKIIVLAED